MDRDVILGFLDETRGYLPRIRDGVRSFAEASGEPAPLAEALRLMHSITGAAAMIGLEPLSRLAAQAEEAMERAAREAPQSAQELAQAVSLTLDRIGLHLDEMAPQEPDFPPELLATFREEAGDHLRELARLLRRLEFDPSDRRVLQGVRRRLHTLKGAAGLVSLERARELAHAMEDLLDWLYEGSRSVPSELIALLFRGLDVLEDLTLGEASGGAEGEALALVPSFAAFRTVPLPERGAPGAEREAPPDDEPALPAGAFAADEDAEGGLGDALRVPLERIDELIRTVGELVVQRSIFEQHIARLTRETEELGASAARLRRLAVRLAAEQEARVPAVALRSSASSAVATGFRAPASPWSGSGSEGFDALELDRYSEGHVLAQELQETTSDVDASGEGLAATRGDFVSHLTRLERLTGELQGGLTRLRLVPFGRLSSLLHRAVRTLAERQGKDVELVLDGERTELDKSALEGLTGPLLHLLRNAVDHGIEPAPLRRERGKPERGRVRVTAAQEGSQIVLRVEDDGAGLDPARIAAAARRLGLVEEAAAAALTPERVFALAFLPGVTTADEVSDISGRGVGLDVVQAEVRRLKGTITVRSVPGESAQFTIHLPLTLAVTRVLLVRAGAETVGVPLTAVSRIARLQGGEIERREEGEVVLSAGAAVQLVRLAEALGMACSPTEGAPSEGAPTEMAATDHASAGVALYLALGGAEVALLVDELRESRQVVVKPLGSLLRRVEGVMGAAVLGDGSVVLILNPAELGAWAGSAERQVAFAAVAEPAAAASGRRVLVVDDSLSVRRSVSSFLRGAGWMPTAARDGVEALEMLQLASRPPDAILLDIEMPRMDGYELAATLRRQAAYRRTPIVMLTSRAGEKHRRKAFEVGATEYLVKPYQEENLLHVLRRVIREGHGDVDRQ
jgi:chemosensory pili system protein ChpA (sensor histidine kinase/response regulator)